MVRVVCGVGPSRPPSLIAVFVLAVIVFTNILPTQTDALFVLSGARSAFDHLFKASPPSKTPQELANVQIARQSSSNDNEASTILAYYCDPENKNADEDTKQNRIPQDVSQLPVLILIHEFFGLSQSICDKADALANELNCIVIAPDTFRGESSTFIPKCIWLALSTRQEQVNQDLSDVISWVEDKQRTNQGISSRTSDNSNSISSKRKLAIMGFCYGGGKAIRYTTQVRPDAATVICYGSPIVDSAILSNLKAPVCGIFGELDMQFPVSQIEEFQNALSTANVGFDVRVYDDVGHAFWKDMEQISEGEQPQTDAYKQVTSFLSMYFA